MFKLIALVFIAAVMAVVVVPEVDGAGNGTGHDGHAQQAADAPAVLAAHVAATTTATAARRRRPCDRNYSGRCLRPDVSDYDCAGGSGNGPYYVRGPFRVVGSDHYGLDSDGDGIACES